MNANDFTCGFTTPRSPHEAFNAINRVSEWWNANMVGSSARLNDKFTVRFGDVFVDMTITESVPDTRVVWLCTDCDLTWLANRKEWRDTRMTWDIIPESTGATVTFTHIGLQPEAECYETCVQGWSHYVVVSLQNLLTNGKGVPERVTAEV